MHGDGGDHLFVAPGSWTCDVCGTLNRRDAEYRIRCDLPRQPDDGEV